MPRRRKLSMYPEYLYNNDTQDIRCQVQELAAKDEPVLRAQCLEVSRQTDTSSLALREACLSKTNAAGAVFEGMITILKELSQSLSSEMGVFRLQNGQAVFSKVCRAVVQIEEERLRLLSCITELTQLRRTLVESVAETNRTLHLLSIAKRAVPEELRMHYAEDTEVVENAYERLKRVDIAVCEVQKFYMTLIESHLPVFMERLRIAADFNHTGAALDGAAIRTLCGELFILQNRAPNVSF